MTDPPPLQATFVGVSTILFSAGQDAILIDGFFTRPSYLPVFLGKIQPDEKIVAESLTRLGVAEAEMETETSPKSDSRTLHAVLVAHTHFDHALDAPLVCKRTGARLVGSESLHNLGRGQGVPEGQIVLARDGAVLDYGALRVRVWEGIHSPGDVAPGDIEGPLAMPTPFKALKTGRCYSFLVEHRGRRAFVHPSANYVKDKFGGVGEVDWLFLGVGVLGKQSADFRDEYWKEVVEVLGPKHVVPIHWDNFWKPLSTPLLPLPWFLDRFSVAEEWLGEKCKAAGITIHMMQAWDVMDCT
ncbi:hypothetical protein J7T55_009637 [Diaporthe amygdali]|uniref:uncharacterized protein n=1 Tax=Phomopsis amygdali TaxID=1214568 RepID=UPI0022FDEB74|nr:uncharacterized protein J7T55_009637 [Diaporthe amygdali]KAJ0109305.1 hypothetical protein J7T55_009637 [Diaporthe amygdali]